MEGLLGHPMAIVEPPAQDPQHGRMFRRWLTFLFMSMAFLCMCIWLASEAFVT